MERGHAILVQPEHVLQLLHGLVTTACGPEGLSQPLPGTHVRSGFEDAPKVADILLKCFSTQRSFASAFIATIVHGYLGVAPLP